jgi:hypothetical protein
MPKMYFIYKVAGKNSRRVCILIYSRLPGNFVVSKMASSVSVANKNKADIRDGNEYKIRKWLVLKLKIDNSTKTDNTMVIKFIILIDQYKYN